MYIKLNTTTQSNAPSSVFLSQSFTTRLSFPTVNIQAFMEAYLSNSLDSIKGSNYEKYF